MEMADQEGYGNEHSGKIYSELDYWWFAETVASFKNLLLNYRQRLTKTY
jgi:hypothetical protein